MYFVYLLQSINDNSRRYIGFTTQTVQSRLDEHNSGKSIHTNKYKPWKCITYIAFENKEKAQKFETYLKHGSGHAFAKKHF
ncbi:MAG: GIY-YIG nuclease family protein [Alphaproteobacteria bacterium]|nr:GIY-YIG nuclease family protein [Alphaproteobacteria bacterium]